MRRLKSRFRDMTIRYDSKCTECGAAVPRGSPAVWDLVFSKVYCAKCGEHLPVQGDLSLKK